MFWAGGISDSLRTDDRFDHDYWRRERSIKVLIASVSETWKLWLFFSFGVLLLINLGSLFFFFNNYWMVVFPCSHRRIVQYKTAYYSFYLPVSEASLLWMVLYSSLLLKLLEFVDFLFFKIWSWKHLNSLLIFFFCKSKCLLVREFSFCAS